MKILLATDASQTAEEAVDFLRSLPVNEEVELILLSVVQMPDLHHVLKSREFEAEFFHKQEAKLREHFEQIIDKFADTPVRFQQRVVQGHPGRTIVSTATELQVDAVVLGSVGESLIDRLLLGSTSKHVATNATCSVLVVRSTTSPPSEKKILAAYDGSEQAIQALRSVAQTGLVGKVPIELVQVKPLDSEREDGRADVPGSEKDQRGLDDAVEQVIRRDESLSQLEITPHVIRASHIGQALCDFASSHPIGMVVVGSTGRGFLARMLLGSVSEYVLQHAACSVWIGREQK